MGSDDQFQSRVPVCVNWLDWSKVGPRMKAPKGAFMKRGVWAKLLLEGKSVKEKESRAKTQNIRPCCGCVKM